MDVAKLVRAAERLFFWQQELAATATNPVALRLIDAALVPFLAGHWETCVRRLEYAQRSAPSHRGVALLLGFVRLLAGHPTATEPLEFLLAGSSSRDAWFGLAAARLQAGNAAAAAAELHEALSRHAPPPELWQRELAADITQLTGARGWCSLTPSGILLLGGLDASVAQGRLAIAADGALLQVQVDPAQKNAASDNIIYLPDGWAGAQRLVVTLDSVPLLGSPLRVRDVTAVSGFVTAEGGAVSGWCWHPGADDHPVRLKLENAASGEKLGEVEAAEPLLSADTFDALERPRYFQVLPDTLPAQVELVRVLGPGRAVLYGNPVDPLGEQQSAVAAADAVANRYPARRHPRPAVSRQPSAPAAVRGRSPVPEPNAPRPTVDVVIPVYRGREVTLKAIYCVLDHDEGLGRLIVVSDASPDANLLRDLDVLAAAGRILLHKEEHNRGFPGAANIGMKLAKGSDVVLLNSDAYVTPLWLGRLQDVAYGAPDIGTVTPIANDATVFSYPQVNIENPLPDDDERLLLAEAAWAANAGVVVDAPSAHGFCMFIRRRCLDDVGLLREDVFGQGYGEENDLSVRVVNKGWRNVVTPGVYVAHVGGQSFASARTHLIRRNLQILNRLHPGYDAVVQGWLRADPLASSRRRIDLELLRGWRRPEMRLVLFMTHSRGGGVLRHVRERMADLERVGLQAALIRPGSKAGTVEFRYSEIEAGHNLCFSIPEEFDGFTETFALLAPVRMQIHHTMDMHPDVMRHVLGAEVPYTVVVHDFHWYCPRITLTRGQAHYCGEPPVEFCRQCVRAEGTAFATPVDPVALQAASREVLKGAGSVIAPSADTARRIADRLGVLPTVHPWERDRLVSWQTSVPGPDESLRVCILGAIGWEKGYGVLLEMAQVIEFKKLLVELRVVGYTCDDARLSAFSCVNITGRYDEEEALRLVEQQSAHVGFVPAVWPETWSYVLTTMWQARLRVAAFDIGAPAERIRSVGGHLFPLATTPEKLLYGLLELGRQPQVG